MMHALLTGNHLRATDDTKRFQEAVCRSIEWDCFFSRRTRNAVFNYKQGEVYNLFFPLQRSAYDIVFVHASVDLFETSASQDFLARAMNAVSPSGCLYLDHALMVEGRRLGRLTKTSVAEVLGVPDEILDGYWVYHCKRRRVPENRSILGWYYDQRAAIVETNVTGAQVVGQSPDIVEALFGDLLYRGDMLDTFPKRLPRSFIDEVVEKVREGQLSADQPALAPELERVAYSWNWEAHGKKFRLYQESWENYLIPGNIYKASTIAAVIRRHFRGRTDLSFLEHGGNAGALTAQLLLELEKELQLGVCCEIDIVPLLNALNLFRHYQDRLGGRMYVRNISADAISYDRQFSVIAFVHMLVYVRRDLLPHVLQRAWDALEPGGLLLFFENTYPPSSLDGVDRKILFHLRELESYLNCFGEIEYAIPGTGQPAAGSEGERMPLFRFLRKPALS